MRLFLIILVTTVVTIISSRSLAGSGSQTAFDAFFRGLASIGNSKGGGKNKSNASLRISGGYTNGSLIDNAFDKTVLTGVNRPEGTYGEADMGGLVSIHFGVSKSFDKNAQMNFNNAGLVASEIELTRYQYGIKINASGKNINPYLGAGYITGPFRMKDTAAEIEYMQTLYGVYWHAGMDVMFGAHLGIRLGYQGEEYIDEKFHALDETLSIKIRSGRAGLLFYF
jgi:hypothetical protein